VVVCATAFAQAEFDRIGAPVQRVPFGVDLDTFTPAHRDPRLHRELAAGADVVLVHCGRLSREKHPQRSIDTITALHSAGARVRLVVAGDGPMGRALERRARHLPVTYLGFLGHREDVARLLASADVALAPGPHETVGLAALEALACGTPVVASRSSALAEIVEPGCGRAVTDEPASFARRSASSAAETGTATAEPLAPVRSSSTGRQPSAAWPRPCFQPDHQSVPSTDTTRSAPPRSTPGNADQHQSRARPG